MTNSDIFVSALLAALEKTAAPGHSSGSVAEAWNRQKMPAQSQGRTAPVAVRVAAKKYLQPYDPRALFSPSSKLKAPNMNPHIPGRGPADK